MLFMWSALKNPVEYMLFYSSFSLFYVYSQVSSGLGPACPKRFEFIHFYGHIFGHASVVSLPHWLCLMYRVRDGVLNLLSVTTNRASVEWIFCKSLDFVRHQCDIKYLPLLFIHRNTSWARMPINNWNFYRAVSVGTDHKSWLSDNPQVNYQKIKTL